ncbi:MAG TPA: hypothetical protein VMM93_01635 [Vicinamibacterales bacterium]|nr:hypothetical protein [Vicinamibacterales bacterium]
MTGRLLRPIAMVIALLGVVDPAMTIDEPVRPMVALSVAADADAVVERVASALGDRFVAVPVPVAGAVATVAVGDVPGDGQFDGSIPAFVIVDDTPRVVISRLDVPERALSGEQIPVGVTLRPVGGGGSVPVTLELLVGGTLAERQTVDLSGRAAADLRLSFVPGGTGPHHVHVTARGAGVASAADALVTVVDERWRVIVHDARPAWPSTFLRRALEADARFLVSARVATSRRADVASGGPPVSIEEAAGLDTVDVIVVGVPDALTARESAALERFMRERGGAVIFLLDQMPAGRVAGVSSWVERLRDEAVALLDAAGVPVLEVSEMAVPRAWPAAARPMVTVAGGGQETVVWEQPVGSGRLIVSGALDAWRYRASAASRFDQFWTSAVADAASRVPKHVEIRMDPRVVRPGGAMTMRVDVRPGGVVSEAESVGAWLDAEGARAPIRLWPVAPGTFEARVEAPDVPGVHRAVVRAEAGEVAADFVVAPDATAVAAEVARLGAWSTAHGGRLVLLSTIADPHAGLLAALDAIVTPSSRPVVWHPMRSAWWIVPFALVLGGEWWRRRRGP